MSNKKNEYVICYRIFDYTVIPEIVLFTERKKKKKQTNLFLDVVWLSP